MSRMCLPQRNNFHTLSTVVVVCGAASRLSARAAIDLPDWLRLSGVSPLPRGASSHALGVAVNALPWFAACAGVLCVRPWRFCSNVHARACLQRQSVWNASSCRPAAVECRLSSLFRATVPDLVRPLLPPPPPPMCADRGAQSRRPLPRPCGASCESTDGEDAGAHFPLRPRACTYLHVYINVRVRDLLHVCPCR